MSRKKTDQWTSDGATDYKTRPQGPDDAAADDRKFSESMETRFARAQPIPPDVLKPGVEQAREEEIARQRQQRERKGKRRRSK